MAAQRFQTVMSLYSDSLSAVILLTDKQLDCSAGIEAGDKIICSFKHFNVICWYHS